MKSIHAMSVLWGFLGGILGAYGLSQLGVRGALLPPSVAAATPTPNTLGAQAIRLVDANGKTRAMLGLAGDGDPALFFFDRQGRNRLVLGLYSPSEGELPFVVLNDTRQRAAGIFRLFGAQESPVVVLKNSGQDRSIYGLNPASLEPFLVNIAPNGSKSNVFGAW